MWAFICECLEIPKQMFQDFKTLGGKYSQKSDYLEPHLTYTLVQLSVILVQGWILEDNSLSTKHGNRTHRYAHCFTYIRWIQVSRYLDASKDWFILKESGMMNRDLWCYRYVLVINYTVAHWNCMLKLINN